MEIHRNSEFTAMPNSPLFRIRRNSEFLAIPNSSQFRITRNSEFLAIPRYLEFLVNVTDIRGSLSGNSFTGLKIHTSGGGIELQDHCPY